MLGHILVQIESTYYNTSSFQIGLHFHSWFFRLFCISPHWSPWLAVGWWFSLRTSVSSTNKTDRNDITEMLLKVALSTITLTHFQLWITRAQKPNTMRHHFGKTWIYISMFHAIFYISLLQSLLGVIFGLLGLDIDPRVFVFTRLNSHFIEWCSTLTVVVFQLFYNICIS